MKKLNIGLDFDGTVTADPETFKKIIKVFMDAGHYVHIVTMRYGSECDDIVRDFGSLVSTIVPTKRQAKDQFCKDVGIMIDFWIDDNPKAVYQDANEIWGWHTPEGIVAIHDPATGLTNMSVKKTGVHVASVDPNTTFVIDPASLNNFKIAKDAQIVLPQNLDPAVTRIAVILDIVNAGSVVGWDWLFKFEILGAPSLGKGRTVLTFDRSLNSRYFELTNVAYPLQESAHA